MWPPQASCALPVDGSGPLDLGLEPPRKHKASAKAAAEEYSFREAINLKIKPCVRREFKPPRASRRAGLARRPRVQ